MTSDERLERADELLQESLGYLVENRRGMAKICMMEALGHVQAVRDGMNSPRFSESPNHHHHQNHLAAPHVTVATTHGWDA